MLSLLKEAKDEIKRSLISDPILNVTRMKKPAKGLYALFYMIMRITTLFRVTMKSVLNSWRASEICRSSQRMTS